MTGNTTQIAEDRCGLRLDGDAGGRIRTSASGAIAARSRDRKLATILVTISARLIHLWAKGSPSLPLLPSVDGRAWLGYAPAFNVFPETNTHRS